MKIAVSSTNISDIKLGANQINKVYVGSVQVWSNAPDYFWVENTSDTAGNILISKTNSGVSNTVDVEYSTDKMTWTPMGTIDSSTFQIYTAIPANSKMYLRATATAWGTASEGVRILGKTHKVGGNILSLLYGSSFTGTETTAAASAFSHLFYGNTALTDASELVIPMTTIDSYAMNSMFYGNTALTAPPDLSHVTRVEGRGMSSMFSGCSSLAGTLDLSNVTRIDIESLRGLLYNCTSITSCDLSALTTVSTSALAGAFQGCTSFNAVDIRSMTTWDTAKSSNWLNQTAATGTVTIGSALDGVIGTNDDSAVPAGWSTAVAS